MTTAPSGAGATCPTTSPPCYTSTPSTSATTADGTTYCTNTCEAWRVVDGGICDNAFVYKADLNNIEITDPTDPTIPNTICCTDVPPCSDNTTNTLCCDGADCDIKYFDSSLYCRTPGLSTDDSCRASCCVDRTPITTKKDWQDFVAGTTNRAGGENTHYTQDIQYRGKTCIELKAEIEAGTFDAFDNSFDADLGTRGRHYKSNMDSINVCQTSSSDPTYESRCKVGQSDTGDLLENIDVDIYDHYCTELNTCTARDASTWIADGYSVTTPAGTTVPGLGTVSCVTGYNGAAVVECASGTTSGSDPFTTSDDPTGCTLNTCTAKTASEWLALGYDVTTPAGTTVSGLGTVSCATGYEGTSFVECASGTPGTFTATGCTEVTCTRPTNNAYDFGGVAETLSGGDFDVTGLSCATGYAGTASATVCATNGADYTVGGCSEITCTRPTNNAYDFGSVTETSLNGLTFDVTGLACATGYGNPGVTPTALVCLDNGTYRLNGCGVNSCIRPTDVGYDFSGGGLSETLDIPNFAVTGITCATGYNGTVTATPCQGDGSPYSVDGCTENTCNLLTNDEKEIYIFGTPDATTVSTLGTRSCSDNYDGDSSTITVTCNGNFVLNGCSNRSGYCFNNTNDNQDVDCGGNMVSKQDRTLQYTSEQEKLSECCDHVTCGNESIQGVCAAAGKVTININATCTETATTSVQADLNACAAVADLTTSAECNAVQLTAGSNATACTYTAGSNTELSENDIALDLCCRDETCADWISENANTCDASNNRFYCSLVKGDMESPNESRCCSDNGCSCSSLDSTTVCTGDDILGDWTFLPNDDSSKSACCVDSESIQVSITANTTCEEIHTLCDGDPNNDGDTLSALGARLTLDTGEISRVDCDQLPYQCFTCQDRECSGDKVPVSTPTCTAIVEGGSGTPLCLESDCCTGPPTTCSGFDCDSSTKELDGSPGDITCTGVECTPEECCTVQPFTNMEGFQNNYQVVSMADSYLIEGLENQQTFEIPMRIEIKPKVESIGLSVEEMKRRIDGGITISELGINVESIRSPVSYPVRHQEPEEKEKIEKIEKTEKTEKNDKYKMIGIITSIVVFVLVLLYLIISKTQRNPLLDILKRIKD